MTVLSCFSFPSVFFLSVCICPFAQVQNLKFILFFIFCLLLCPLANLLNLKSLTCVYWQTKQVKQICFPFFYHSPLKKVNVVPHHVGTRTESETWDQCQNKSSKIWSSNHLWKVEEAESEITSKCGNCVEGDVCPRIPDLSVQHTYRRAVDSSRTI